ncbi:SDR family NAD(P)-dependent oxidoreductase [Gordonia sp. NPDC003424]
MTQPHLEDSTVVVVGGDTELGRLVALHFVRAGCQRIGIVGVDPDAAEATAQAVFGAASGIWAIPACGDLSSTTDAERVVAELAASLGDADIVVTCLSNTEVVSDVVRQSMTASGGGITIGTGPPTTEQIGGVWVCTISEMPEAVHEDRAAEFVKVAIALRSQSSPR